MKEPINQIAEIEISYRPAISHKPIIKSSLDSYSELLKFFPEQTLALQERAVVMYLNRNNRVLGVYPLSTGGITGTVIDVRLVLSVALKIAAVGIVISHNHPSQNLKPSSADIAITEKLKAASKLIDITLLDHIILGPEKGQYFSFADEGLL